MSSDADARQMIGEKVESIGGVVSTVSPAQTGTSARLLILGATSGERISGATRDAADAVPALVALAPEAALFSDHPGLHIVSNSSEMFQCIGELLDHGDVAVVLSADLASYQLIPVLRATFSGAVVRVVSGTGSLAYLLSAMGERGEGGIVLSAHGHEVRPGTVAATVVSHRTTLLLLGDVHNPRWLADALVNHGLGDVRVVIGEHLSYPDERIIRDSPARIAQMEFVGPLSAAVINAHPTAFTGGFGLDDEAFLHSGIAITGRAVRAIVLSLLRLAPDAVVWDIGAGSGSVSIECARLAPYGDIYALERNPGSVEVARANARRFGFHNIEVVLGEAPDVLDLLPNPTHVFIGGADDQERVDILAHVARRPGMVRTALAIEDPVSVPSVMRAMSTHGYTSTEGVQVASFTPAHDLPGGLGVPLAPVTVVAGVTSGLAFRAM
jgi:precorrin-6Y C5,15-methyltransferase (decarboxylating)